MAEYIEREALIQTIHKDPWIGAQGKDYALCDIAEQPTADVVEVIRCKDCKHFGKNKEYRDTKLPFSFCNKFHHNITRENDFCSYGCAKMDGKGDNDG